MDPTLSFKNHVKILCKTVNFNLCNFRQIRSFLPEKAAKMFLHCMIFSHIEYCITNWSLTNMITLKPIESLYKKALKIFDRKPFSFHHCLILQKHNILNLENFKTFKLACSIYKILHGLSPPSLKDFIKFKSSTGARVTRASVRGDCVVPHRDTAFSKNVLSVKGTKIWNNIPKDIRACATFMLFKIKLKCWLKRNQTCDHWCYLYALNVELCERSVWKNIVIFYFTFLFPMYLCNFLICQVLQMETSHWLILAYLHIYVH